jgi:hypothetical protein
MSIIIVASHHKAGSTYAKKCFYEVASILGFRFKFYGFGECPDALSSSLSSESILCFSHARYVDIKSILNQFGRESCKLVHIIRDPRTLIVSATKYHLDSDEYWLSEPRDKFAGASYQEALRALPCYSDQLIFEMMNGSRGTLLDMAQIYNEGIATATIKLEEISWDTTGISHGQLSAHLVDDSLLLPLIKSVFLKHSLFSLLTPPRHARTMVSPSAKDDVSGHVRQMYRNLFGDLHLDLGYKD